MAQISDSERCEERVSDGGRMMSSHRCEFRAKGEHDGRHLCGVHLRAIVERDRKDREYDERRSADEAHSKRLAALEDKHGVDVQADYLIGSRQMSHTRVVISLDDFLRLIGET